MNRLTGVQGAMLALAAFPMQSAAKARQAPSTASSQLSVPVPVGDMFDVRQIFSPNDMPAYVQIAEINRYVPARLTVQPDGTLQDCKVKGSSGDPKMDAYSCALILKRAKVHGAKWMDGSPAYGVLGVPVSWVIGTPPPDREVAKAFPPDMEFTVTKLPSGERRSARFELQIAADENGHVLSCEERTDGGRWPRAKFPELVPIACAQVQRAYTASPPQDPSGKPVRSVQTMTVEFKVGG